MGDTRDRPVITGLVALVGVAVVVGLLTGLAAIVGTRIIGLGGESDSSAGEPREEQSLYLPDPVRTEEEGGPLVTLAGTPSQQAEERALRGAVGREAEDGDQPRRRCDLGLR